MNANKNSSEQLLKLFYEGQTSENEEALLKQIMLSSSVEDGRLEGEEEEFFGQMFPPEGFEERMAQHIDKLATHRKYAIGIVNLGRGKWIAGIAASVAVLISVGIYVNRDAESCMEADTYATPEEAYRDTQHALSMFSNTLNRGFEKLEKFNKQ